MPSTTERIREMALDAGFDIVGFGPASPDGATGNQFDAWLDAGRHGEMHWLERERDRILAGDRYVRGARGAIALGFEYPGQSVRIDGASVARYAAGRDYHRGLGTRLRRLQARMASDGIGAGVLRYGVDAVPVLERSLALQAGIGFLAKSAGIIHPRRGPWLLLAEILHGDEFEPTSPAPGSCGTCTACLDACPTGALVAPHELDARLCLSYTTIEKRGVIDRSLRAAQGSWLFGCDICIEVCPFTSRATKQRDDDPDLALHPALETYTLVGVLEMDVEAWNRDWTGTAIRRAKVEGLRRNAAIVAGNLHLDQTSPALASCLHDSNAGVRTAAGWALAKLGTHRNDLVKAIDREHDETARDDLALSLDEFGSIG
ncbi:MAG: tRNA epoxyqueuosine(34) reductase QueG [Planctomycetes bacterium]|nr:tRNA epoxyqueuosine(34) reductase QueG [Planctomycetota bacterium]MCB9916923.1 tRNA epoxyqueuosine(34) reductase QueG [Planctomycetota bacterium]